MALELNLKTCITNCEEITIAETAGIYTLPNNLTGWGTPNLGRTDNYEAKLTVKYIPSSGVEQAIVTDLDVRSLFVASVTADVEIYSGTALGDGIYSSFLTVNVYGSTGTFTTLNSGNFFQAPIYVQLNPTVPGEFFYYSDTGFETIEEFVEDFNTENTGGFTMTYTDGVITITSTSPEYSGLTIVILIDDSAFNAELEDSSTIVATYTAENEVTNTCNVKCCIERMAAKHAATLCKSCSSDNTFIKAETLYRALDYIAVCYGKLEFLKILTALEKVCASSDCGCK